MNTYRNITTKHLNLCGVTLTLEQLVRKCKDISNLKCMNIKAKRACKIERSAFGKFSIETEEVQRWTVREQ
jgi:hypothetical protein